MKHRRTTKLSFANAAPSITESMRYDCSVLLAKATAFANLHSKSGLTRPRYSGIRKPTFNKRKLFEVATLGLNTGFQTSHHRSSHSFENTSVPNLSPKLYLHFPEHHILMLMTLSINYKSTYCSHDYGLHVVWCTIIISDKRSSKDQSYFYYLRKTLDPKYFYYLRKTLDPKYFYYLRKTLDPKMEKEQMEKEQISSVNGKNTLSRTKCSRIYVEEQGKLLDSKKA
ncbi:hypothetical protein V1478_006005 [Vespula squamosa]|uniref:Uncharacterized protein n=1 Tax=Vespula squamosa TaxID=30214 RepID=A0ABD2B915_VESSQ